MAIPKPKPEDWILANAREIQVTDREVLAMLRDAKKRVDKILADLPQGKQDVRRAQLEQTRARLLAEQAAVFERLGDIVSARRARSASRAARLSAAADNALLRLVGKGAQGQFLYESALQVGQRAIDTAMARMKLSTLPLSKRIYNSSVWMGGRLNKLINETLASGLNAQEFAKRARDWFNPNTPGGVRYAAMRLARTEINNAFHSMSAQKYADTPWVAEVEWNLSKAHPKPDICNTVHAESPFPADRVPARPHPQCMCYITPKAIDEDEFVNNFIKGDYDQFLDDELAKNGWKEPEQEQTTKAADAGTPQESKPSELRISIIKTAQTPDKPVGDVLAEVKSKIKTDHAEVRSAAEKAMEKIHSLVGDKLERVTGVTQEKRAKNGLGGGAYAHCDKGHVHLAHDVHQNQHSMRQGMVGSNSPLGGYMVHGSGNPLENLNAHEMGHALLQRKYLSKTQQNELRDQIAMSLGLPEAGFDLWELVKGQNGAVIKRKIGSYARRSADELLAEIWAEYTLNPQASREVREIGDKIRALIIEGKRSR